MPSIFREMPAAVGALAVLRASALLAVFAAIFMLVLKISMAGAYQDSNPARALAWAPFDAIAKANAAALILAADGAHGGRAQARAFSFDAIRRDPTRVIALRTLGLVADSEGERPQARRLLAQSERLSRRDQLTQIWLVNDHYRRGDSEGMVRHFDIAARASTRSWPLLFSTMAYASADSRIAAPLAERLSGKPNWWLSFVTQLVATGPQLERVVVLTRGLLNPGVTQERGVIDNLLQRLTTAGKYDLAWTVYGEAARGRQMAPLNGFVRDGGFEAGDGFAPFDWLVGRAPDLGAVRQLRPDSGPGNALSLYAASGQSGEVARQLLRLAPGAYRLQVDVGGTPVDPFDRPTFEIACAGAEPGSRFLNLKPPAGGAVRRIGGSFAIPAGCRWQWLTVRVGGGSREPETSPWIDNLVIQRVS